MIKNVVFHNQTIDVGEVEYRRRQKLKTFFGEKTSEDNVPDLLYFKDHFLKATISSAS